MKIKLPILFNPKDIDTYELIGKEVSLSDCKERIVTFYSIDIIHPYYNEDILYTKIFSGGFEFICVLKPEEVEQIINDATI